MRTYLRGGVSLFTVFWLIFSSGTILFNSQINLPFTLSLSFFLVIAHLLIWANNFIIKRATLFIYISLIAWLLLVVIVNRDYGAYLTYLGLIVVMSLAMTTSVVISFDYFIKKFILIVVFIAACSLVMYYGDFLLGLRFLFPVITNGDYQYVNAFVYAEMIDVDRRNLGVFIEPGIFQIYLNLAMLAILLKKERRLVDKLSIAVLLLAIYSTISTTGFIAAVVVLGSIFFSRNQADSVVLHFSKLGIAIFIIFGLTTSEFFVSNIEEKLYGEKSMSYVYRHNAMLADLEIVAKNPFFGDGFGNYKNNLNNSGLVLDSSANTFTQLSANVGVPFVLVLVSGFAFFALKMDLFLKIAFFSLYFLFFSTEPFLLSPIFYFFTFVSMQKKTANG